MNLEEVLVEPDDDGSDLVLTQFSKEDEIEIEPWMSEVCDQLVGLENAVQVRMVLSLYFDELDWGGTAD